MIDVTGGTFTVSLPTAVGKQGRLLVVKNNGGGAVTVDPYQNETIDGKPFVILGETNTIQLASNGTEWVALGYNISTVNSSTGVFEFTGLTVASPTTFTVAPVKGWIVDDTTNPLSPQLYYVVFTGGTYTAVYVNTDTETWVYLTSGGTISQSNIELTEQQRRQNIFLGKLGHANKTNIINAFSQPDFVLSPLSQLRDMFNPIGFINGGIYASPNGVNLSFNTSAGYLYGLGINFASNTLNPNAIYVSGNSPTTFQYRTQTGGTTSNTTSIDPTKYDVGGVVTSISGTKATNQRIYLVQNGIFRVQYGQTEYNQLTAAIEGIATEQFNTFSNFTNNGILIGVLSVLSTATDLSDTTKARFFFTSKFGETVGAAGGVSTTTLQQAYNNSVQPEITTNSTLGALSVKNGAGTGDNVTNVFEGVDSSGVTTSFVRADGAISGTSIFGVGLTANTISATTYQNLPQDVFVTGGTVTSGGTLDIFRNDNVTVSISGVTYWTSGSTGLFSIKSINDTGLDSTGDRSVAWGNQTLASGNDSTAWGVQTSATTVGSTSSGNQTIASGLYSHAEGNSTTASGIGSHAEGDGTTASGNYSHSEGVFTVAYAEGSHAEGNNTTTISDGSHAEGSSTSTGWRGFTVTSVVSGLITIADNVNYSSEFSSLNVLLDNKFYTYSTTNFTSPNFTIQLDDTTVNSGNYVADKLNLNSPLATQILGINSHAEGQNTKALGVNSHAEGTDTNALGDNSHTEGRETTAYGNASHAEGRLTISIGDYSHAEGGATIASGQYSHAEGSETTAQGDYSHSQGSGTTASGNYSFASGIGSESQSEGSFIHSENSVVNGQRSVVLGGQNITGSTNDTVYVPYLNLNYVPTLNNSNTEILSRNTGTGQVEYTDLSAFTSLDTFVTGFTYDPNNNTFTISQNQGQPDLTALIDTMTGLTVTTISATTYYNLPIKVSVDFGFDSTYATTSSTFAQIPLNVVVQSASTYNSTYTGMTATLICDISESDTGITGEFELYDVTNSSSIVGSTTSFVDTDGLKSSSSFTITSSDFDDTFRVRIRRTSGTGTDNVRIRSAQLLLTLV
jgi:hypothetical protein